ncbi:preprotein translocase subunit SecE [Candidatus Sumerlaeota bacterium]|nr:preprotein translocase subunit SecE [Candidatus Sumerlaeota bacterium]
MISRLLLLVILAGAIWLIVRYRETLKRWYEKAVIFLKEVRVEIQKVVWPSKQEVYGATFVVLIAVVILTLAIGIEDRLLSAILDQILRLTTKSG